MLHKHARIQKLIYTNDAQCTANGKFPTNTYAHRTSVRKASRDVITNNSKCRSNEIVWFDLSIIHHYCKKKKKFYRKIHNSIVKRIMKSNAAIF